MTTGERSHALHTVDLDLHPNEASDLLPVEADQLLRARDWDLAFWTVLDEGSVEDFIAVIGQARGASPEEDAWEIVRTDEDRVRVRYMRGEAPVPAGVGGP